MEGPDAGDDERGQNEIGCVGHRRQRVGREYGKTGDARQALVMRQVGWNGFAEKQPFQANEP